MSERGFQIPAGALDKLEDRTGRVLTCTRCDTAVRVYEAAHGARTDAEHQFLDPAAYVCGACLEDTAVDDELELRDALDRAEAQAAHAAATGDPIPY